jgi:D-serine deaminase-like pyridoxal phosphate-dependent protein
MDAATLPGLTLATVPTPSLVLELPKLRANLSRMAAALRRHNLAFRPHLKTAKCVEVAALATTGQAGGITVSTLAEAEAFAAAGHRDLLYSMAMVPSKLDRVAAIGAAVKIVTDDLATARAIAAHPHRHRALIEIDSGAHRAGLDPADPALLAVAGALGRKFAGLMTHGGHSYGARDEAAAADVAAQERAAALTAADRLRAAGHPVDIISVGSSPSALNAADLSGITEVRAGVYMFQDLMQVAIGAAALSDIAASVVASVVKVKPGDSKGGELLIDAGALALSADRGFGDTGFGRVALLDGTPTEAFVQRVWQEHGLVSPAPESLRVGDRVRILPVHTCHTCAGHARYLLTEDGQTISGTWERIAGW